MASEDQNHAHHEHHHHDMSHNDRNIAHWDKVAKTYTSDHTQQQFGDFINKINEFILNNLSKIGVDFLDPSTTFEAPDNNNNNNNTTTTPQKQLRVLDYACGPGTITAILAGRATEFVGLDISPNMVKEYNERFSSNNADNSEKINAQAFQANLFDPAGPPPSLSSPQFHNFDLIAVSGGYHHFEDLPLVTRRLVERLRPGGVLMIIDFKSHAPEDLGAHPAINTIAHHGFTEEGVRALFGGTGLEDIGVWDFESTITIRGTVVRQPFMARGRKVKAVL